jgi:uncharacterized protein
MVYREKVRAYVAPMGAFIALLAVDSSLPRLANAFWLQHPEYWLYPLQTAICAALLWIFWRAYEFQPPARLAIGLAVGILVFAIWIAPQAFLRFPPRGNGFNPEVFSNHARLYWFTVLVRFLRLVLVVPLIEEIFWRGFLLRYLINERFDQLPFGTFSWLSFSVVTAAFCFSHSTPDWPAAAVTGALYNWVAYRTKSLSTCVMTHALTNLLLGLWIMSTKQWGFW